MNTRPIVAVRPVLDAEGQLRSPLYDDVYHPHDGGLRQARDVFLAGNGLPDRWRRQDRFVILETGFGLGNNFLATWAAHRADADRCRRLHFIAIEAHPLAAGDLAALPREPGVGALAAELAERWPPLTCNLHRLSFDGGAVELLLAFGDVAAWLPQLEARVDAFFLDGFAPARNPAMWESRVLRALGRLAAPGATLATWTAARAVREGLRGAGFAVEIAPGSGGKRDITLARFAPVALPRLAPRRPSGPLGRDRRIVVIGAGLAGCAAAWALARQGRACTVIERRTDIATEGSGNAAGIFHGVVHGADGHHARFNRAAALEAAQVIAEAIGQQGVAGACEGLLRMSPGAVDAGNAGNAEALAAVAARLGLPPTYVEALPAPAASARAGIHLDDPAWFFPGGGWVHPAGLARAYLAQAGAAVTLRLGVEVAALRREGPSWSLLDANGRVVETADVIVLANAGDAFRLLGDADPAPVIAVRGQVSGLATGSLPSAFRPRLPLAGSGWVVPAHAGRIWFGATADAGDDDREVRLRDHRDNVARLAGLVGLGRLGEWVDDTLDITSLQGRTAWRWVSDDRLPLIGAVPAAWAASLSPGGDACGSGTRPTRRFDQPRFIERCAGLFVFTALGSRGIAWSTLGGQVLAAAVTGAPCPLEADLIDAVDPARFISRMWRRSQARPAPAGQAPLPPGPAAGALAAAG